MVAANRKLSIEEQGAGQSILPVVFEDEFSYLDGTDAALLPEDEVPVEAYEAGEEDEVDAAVDDEALEDDFFDA